MVSVPRAVLTCGQIAARAATNDAWGADVRSRRERGRTRLGSEPPVIVSAGRQQGITVNRRRAWRESRQVDGGRGVKWWV